MLPKQQQAVLLCLAVVLCFSAQAKAPTQHQHHLDADQDDVHNLTAHVTTKIPQVLEDNSGSKDDSKGDKVLGMAGCDFTKLVVNEIPQHPARNLTDSFGSGMTSRDVLSHVIRSLGTARLGSIDHTPLMHTDGRIARPVIAVVGAEAGEFLLALNAFEDLIGTNLTDFQIASLLSDYVLWTDKPFTFQTDTAALEHLCRTTKFCLPNRIDAPPAEMIPLLRVELIKPENQGCAHFRHVLQYPEQFQTRLKLTQSLVVALFNLVWGVPVNNIGRHALKLIQSRIKLVVLQGKHSEGGLLHVDTAECSPHTVPMLTPEIGPVSLALHYDHVALYSRIGKQKFLISKAPQYGGSSETVSTMEGLKDTMTSIAQSQFEAALVLDGGRTPMFNVHWPASCCATTTPPQQ